MKDHFKIMSLATLFNSSWQFDGMPEEQLGLKLELVWKIQNIEGKGVGICIDTQKSKIPAELEITYAHIEDIFIHNGQVYWKMGMNGVHIRYKGHYVPLMKVDRIEETYPLVYFYALPTEIPVSWAIVVEDSINFENASRE